MSRKSWLRQRSKRKQLPPAPVRLIFANAAGVSTREGRTREIVLNTFVHAARMKVAAVGFAEVRDIDVEPLAPANWVTVQYGRTDSEEHGVALAVDKSEAELEEHLIKLGSKATQEGSWKTGAGIGDRFFIVGLVKFGKGATSWKARLKPGHAPPPRSPNAREKFVKEFVEGGGITMADWNLPRRMVARATGHRVVGEGVTWIAVPRKFKIKLIKAFHIGSDHLAIAVEIW